MKDHTEQFCGEHDHLVVDIQLLENPFKFLREHVAKMALDTHCTFNSYYVTDENRIEVVPFMNATTWAGSLIPAWLLVMVHQAKKTAKIPHSLQVRFS